MRRILRKRIERLAHADASAERQWLTDSRRHWAITWSWLWLTWSLGISAAHDPYGDDDLTLMLGPLTVSIERVRLAL